MVESVHHRDLITIPVHGYPGGQERKGIFQDGPGDVGWGHEQGEVGAGKNGRQVAGRGEAFGENNAGKIRAVHPRRGYFPGKDFFENPQPDSDTLDSQVLSQGRTPAAAAYDGDGGKPCGTCHDQYPCEFILDGRLFNEGSWLR